MMAASLRPLREDLDIHPAPAHKNGQPSWTVHDITANRFFSIGRRELLILKHWHLGEPDAIVAAVNTQFHPGIARQDVEETAVFLAKAQLLQASSARDTDYLLTLSSSRKQSLLMTLLHHYLSFRIPLVRPARFLRRTVPMVRWIYSPLFLTLTLTAGLLGGAMVSVRWDEFTSFIPDMLTPTGIIGAAMAMAMAKTLHEFGHAFTAARFGCRVGTMGVAIILGCPMLFTDATEAWKLSSHRERFLVSFAGLGAELILACWSLLLWNMVEAGPLRDAFFLFSSVTWLISLAVNASPFMRFDGYYLLMDFWGIPNLQTRAFALARWKLRTLLFRLDTPPPDDMPDREQRLMIGYAICTWIYRVTLFLGIAYMVYSYFFKVLGIILMSVEIGWFLVLPVLREVRGWWEMRQTIGVHSMIRPLALLLGALAFLLAVPLPMTVQIPAVLKCRDEIHIYAPGSGRLDSFPIHLGDTIQPGQLLAHLSSPEIERAVTKSVLHVKSLEQRIAAANMGTKETGELSILQEEMRAAKAALQERENDRARLTLTAPQGGKIIAVDESLHEKTTITMGHKLMLIDGSGVMELRGLVDSEGFSRLKPGMPGYFYPDNLSLPLMSCVVIQMDNYADRSLPWPILADVHGGQIESTTDRTGSNQRISQSPMHSVQFSVDSRHSNTTQLRGTVLVRIFSEPFLIRILKHVRTLWIREISF